MIRLVPDPTMLLGYRLVAPAHEVSKAYQLSEPFADVTEPTNTLINLQYVMDAINDEQNWLLLYLCDEPIWRADYQN